MCQILDVPYVPYQCLILEGTKSTTLVSACPTMIKRNQEFISAYEVLQERKEQITNSPKDYELYLSILKEHHVPYAEEYVQKMFMVDFILANEDRHLGNFGIIRDLDTMEWISVCPVFDTGRSLNTNIAKKYWLDEVVDMKFFSYQFVQSDIVSQIFSIPVSYKQIQDMYDVVNLFEEILLRFQTELRLNLNDIDVLKQSFKKRIKLFEKIMTNKGLINEREKPKI